MDGENKKDIVVFSQRLAGYLMLHGFVLIDMRPDNQDSRRNVFFFNNTPELHGAIKQYKAKRFS